MADDNAAYLEDARQLVSRALSLIVAADETLAAAELEQALSTIERLANAARVSSAAAHGRPSAIQ
jgi:hypothetical protein